MSQKILIVGGSGNLGNKICNFLIKTNNKLFNLDKRKTKNLNKISFIKCDLTKKISKKNYLEILI